MSNWDKVEANITFPGPVGVFGRFPASWEAPFLGSLAQLYAGSPKARALLDGEVDRGGTINVFQSPAGIEGVAPLPLGFGNVAYNLDAINHFYYFNDKGVLVKEIPGLTYIYELFQAIAFDSEPIGAGPRGAPTDAQLNNPGFDQVGDKLRDTRIVAEQMQYNDNIQVSFFAALSDSDRRFSMLRPGISYSDGEKVANVRLGDIVSNGENNFIDFSRRTDGGNYLAFGFGGNDTIVGGGPGDDFLYGGTGDDTLVGGSGNNLLDGGDRKTPSAQLGTDTADYSGDFGQAGRQGVKITIDPGSDPASAYVDGVAPIMVTNNGFGGTDRLISIEKIKLTGHNDTVTVGPTFGQALETLQEVDANTQNPNSGDVLDLTRLGKSITFDHDKILGFNTVFKNFNVLQGDPGNDTVNLDTPDDKSFKEVDFGDGNDTISSSDAPGLTINLGNGTDLVGSVAKGTIVNAGRGKDTFIVSNDELITGTGGNVNDVIADQGGLVLHGFVGPLNSDSPWITSIYDGISYGINTQGDLVIKDTLGNETFVSGYVGGPNLPLSDQTDGIFVGRGQFKSSRLLDLKRPFIEQIPTIFKFGNEIWFARTGKPFFPGNDDPLVLDLTGAGVNLTGESEAAPIFDMQGTGFAVHTGWIQPNDAFLVMQTADGQIQLVGGNGSAASGSGFSSGTGATGFAALAQYDVNGDGVIDASDPIYSQLMIWQDANGNGVADPGELQTLAQAGITSISLNATASGATVAGNTIDPTATFTFANGTTGTIADVLLSIDPYNSKYLGNTTVSAAAAAMPNLKGYGTLTHQSFVTEPTNL